MRVIKFVSNILKNTDQKTKSLSPYPLSSFVFSFYPKPKTISLTSPRYGSRRRTSPYITTIHINKTPPHQPLYHPFEFIYEVHAPSPLSTSGYPFSHRRLPPIKRETPRVRFHQVWSEGLHLGICLFVW